MPIDITYRYEVTTRSCAEDGSWRTETEEKTASGKAYDFSAANGSALCHFKNQDFSYAKPVMSSDTHGFVFDTGATVSAVSSVAECWMTVPVSRVSIG